MSLARLSTRLPGERLAPHYLGPRDEPWLRALLDEHARYCGRKRAELRERLLQPLSTPTPKHKLRLAAQVLERLIPDAKRSSVSPRELRWRVFRTATGTALPREAVLSQVAAELGISEETADQELFADLAGERRLGAMPADLSASSLCLLVNQALVLRLLKRARSVRIVAWGNTHALLRHARRLGLICGVSRAPERSDEQPSGGVVLDISGPFALFRKTEVYGRALSSLLPRAASCRDFELQAECALGKGPHVSTLLVTPSDPIFPARELPLHDSRVETRFATDFGRAALQWELLREPPPLEVAGALLCPDFELVHRYDPERRWLIEIVGFWTPQYLREKLQRFREAGLERVILCVDSRRRCSDDDLPACAHIVRYQKRIDPRDILAIVDG